jgi:hypothetical protein
MIRLRMLDRFRLCARHGFRFDFRDDQPHLELPGRVQHVPVAIDDAGRPEGLEAINPVDDIGTNHRDVVPRSMSVLREADTLRPLPCPESARQ